MVLLTGAAGFIGRQCIPHLLRDGFEIHAHARTRPSGPAGGVVWHSGDLLDSSATELLLDEITPSHLLHTAWCPPGVNWGAPENHEWVDGSDRLLRAFAERGGRRAVVTGSCAEYDWRFDRYAESVPLAPKTVYGRCKATLHDRLMALSATTGLSSAWGRLFFTYGPGEHPSRLVASVTTAMLRGEEARCSHGRQIRDWLHASDVAGALVALLTSKATGAVNIAAGVGHSVRDVVAIIAAEIGRPDLPRFGVVPSGPDDAPSIVADVTRLSGEVGWRPRFDLRAGLADTIGYLQRSIGVAVSDPNRAVT